jgi:hypothetical protein
LYPADRNKDLAAWLGSKRKSLRLLLPADAKTEYEYVKLDTIFILNLLATQSRFIYPNFYVNKKIQAFSSISFLCKGRGCDRVLIITGLASFLKLFKKVWKSFHTIISLPLTQGGNGRFKFLSGDALFASVAP